MSDESTSPKTSEMRSRLKASLRKKPTLLVLAGVAVALLAVAAALEFLAPAPLSFSEVSWTVDYEEDAVTYELNPHLTLTAKVANTTGDDIGDWYKYKGLCYGCADMISTAADLEKWGEEFIVNKLLSDNIITLMTTDYLGGYGYGITPDMGDGFVYHDGNLPPYCSTLSVNRSKGLVLVLLDCDYSSPLLSMRHDIFTAVTQLED